MKNFKRTIIIILALICALTLLSSCSDKSVKEDDIKKEDASEIYLAAKKKTDALDCFGAKMTIERAFSDNEYVSKDVSLTSVQYKNTDALEFYNEYATDISITDGSAINTVGSMYYAEGILYQKNSDTEKYIYTVDEETEDMLAQTYSNVSLELDPELFSESIIERGELVSVASEPDASALQETLSTFVGAIDSYYTSENEEFTFSYTNVKLGFTVNSAGYFTEMTIEYTADFEHTKGNSSIDIKVRVAYEDTDGEVEIDPPADLSEYTLPLGENEKTQDELEEEYMNDVLALFDADNNRIADFNKRYVELCQKYGKASVDTIVDAFEMAKIMQE